MPSKKETRYFIYGSIFGIGLFLIASGILVLNPQLINPEAAKQGGNALTSFFEFAALVVTILIYAKYRLDAWLVGGSTGITIGLALTEMVVQFLF